MDEFSPIMLRREVVLENAKEIIVERGGKQEKIYIDPKYIPILSSNFYKDYQVIGPRIPFVVAEVKAGTPAEKAGLLKDDKIISIDSVPLTFQHEVVKALAESKGKTIDLGFLRNGTEQHTSITIDEKGKIGIALKNPHDFNWTAREEYSLEQSIPGGFNEGVSFMGDWFKGIGQIFKGNVKAKDSLGGFISITKLFSTSWDWESFWRITGILSFILAIMNLLPIPALDGGHVMFLIWEVATGRKPGDKFMEYATYVGFAIVLCLLVFANGLDVMRLFGK
jgi:regulator of sigma E protease